MNSDLVVVVVVSVVVVVVVIVVGGVVVVFVGILVLSTVAGAIGVLAVNYFFLIYQEKNVVLFPA